MKEYYIFNLKKEFAKLYKDRPSELFYIFNRIYYMKEVDKNYGYNLFEQICNFIDKKEINEYLYCYLKCFNYQTMGSTSSIATAVNSKIIKGMPFIVPTNDELEEFHGFAAPMFAKIKANQIEIDNLTALRDTLLPKLMSGELDVSDIDL